MKAASLEVLKARLIGSYVATGTDPDGKPYFGGQTLAIALAPSGALEVEWDGGRNVGVGQISGNVLAVASWARGRTVIMTMTINPDGSLSGKWLRRTDRDQTAPKPGKGDEPKWPRATLTQHALSGLPGSAVRKVTLGPRHSHATRRRVKWHC